MYRIINYRTVKLDGEYFRVEKEDSYMDLNKTPSGNVSDTGHVFIYSGWVLDENNNRTDTRLVWITYDYNQVYCGKLVVELDEWIISSYGNLALSF